MSAFFAEVVGTAVLLLLGGGVCANVALNKTNGNDSGWIVIAFGWAIAVFTGVFISAEASGGHLNPAVTLGFATAGTFPWEDVPMYVAAQFLGAAIGAFLVWLHYRDHFEATADEATKLGVFATGPQIRNPIFNFIAEVIGTFVLVYAVFHIAGAKVGTQSASLGALDALPVALVVLGIGLSLGGNTGYAINPARDLAPRLMHAVLPISRKGSSDWGYSWVPVMGPLVGGVLAALVLAAVG